VGVAGMHCGSVDSGGGIVVVGHQGMAWAMATVAQASQCCGVADSAAAKS